MFRPSASPYPREQSSLIGIAVSIGGNVLISLALNCQKLAHKRLNAESKHPPLSNVRDPSPRPPGPNTEEQPLIPSPNRLPTSNYGLSLDHTPTKSARPERLCITSRPTSPSEASLEELSQTRYRSVHGLKPPDSPPKAQLAQSNETAYLRSKLWWFGFLLMNIGEFGNFLSYAYAPASVVAPLGTVALIANCFFAPLMLKETLHKKDIIGILLSIFGAVTVVGAGRAKDVQLDVDGLIEAVSRRVFIIYAVICLTLIIGLSVLSASRAGRKWIFIDVGLCAVYGGFTVLSTKALSTFISSYWINIFKIWITYPVVAILLFTGLGQVLYLNRALKNFDSKVVIPTFFISFNLSAIIGSAILYEEFQDVSVHQLTTFLYGCLTTFIGVYFLTRETTPPTPAEPTEEYLETGNIRPNTARATAKSKQVLRNRTSLVLSAGQYLLVASSPIRETDVASDMRANTTINDTPVKPPAAP